MAELSQLDYLAGTVEVLARENEQLRARIEQLEIQLLSARSGKAQSDLDVARLSAENAGLREDKARLDWLSANAQDDNHGCRYFEWRHDVTLSAAIDAARGGK